MIRFGAGTCASLDAALAREWLETNGIGGYASSTLCGANTRRYHGLLVTAMKPPLGRMVLLSKIDETLVTAAGRFELGTNLFPDAVHPAGFTLLEEFRLDPWPVWRWNAAGVQIEKSVWLVQGENTLIAEYRSSGAARLELRPLIAFRDYHATTHANAALRADVKVGNGVVSVQPYSDLPALYFTHDDGEVDSNGHWYYRFQYPREKERGLDWEEDLFQPFALYLDIVPEKPARLVVSLDSAQVTVAESQRRKPSSTELVPALERAAEQFPAERDGHGIVIAGYHWFTDWGRDTMISLPGLMLDTNRPDRARDVLAGFAPLLRQGLLPNRYPDAGTEPEYNSTDATLWFVEALRAYVAKTGDLNFVRTVWYAGLKSMVDWRERGTLFNIHIDSDGLAAGGQPGMQLTWMDAKVDGRVITPRDGKPVEIQALWYNALRVIAGFARAFEEQGFAVHCDELAERARGSFAQKFWNDSAECLFDVINGEERDGSVRPNQLFALSLPYPILTGERGPRILDVVRRELLTPFGLRTLSPRDAKYRGRYAGSQRSRDGAYHQGTVWPWLLGPYVAALFAVHGKNAETLEEARAILEPFRAHLLEAGVGQISEVFDGDPPHTPGGCIAQAWSVAQLLDIARLLSGV